MYFLIFNEFEMNKQYIIHIIICIYCDYLFIFLFFQFLFFFSSSIIYICLLLEYNPVDLYSTWNLMEFLTLF